MIRIGPFGGVITSATPYAIPPNRAQAILNVKIETGKLETRNGFSNIANAVAGFQTAYAIDFVKGYETIATPKEAFLAFIAVSGTVKPYEIHPTTGAANEILDGSNPLSLGGGLFKAISYNGQALALKRGSAVYEHNIGDFTHWKNVDQPRPDALAAGPNLGGDIGEDITGSAPLTTIDWSTVTGASFSNLTTATFAAVVGTGFRIDRGASAPANQQAGGFTVAIPGGPVDYSNLKTLTFTITGRLNGNPISLSIKDASGNLLALAVNFTYSGATGIAEVTATVPSGADLSEFNDTAALVFGIPGTQTIAQAIAGTYFADEYVVSAVSPEETSGSAVPTPSGSEKRLRFGYAPYDANRDQESEDVTPGPWVKIDDVPTRFFTDGGAFIANKLTFTPMSPVLPATSTRLYVQFESDMVWRKCATIANGDSASVDENSTTLLAKPPRVLTELTPIGSPCAIAVFKGFVVYGYEQSSRNVRMSAIGQPWRLSRTTDTTADTEAGADWSIADAFDDVPREIIGSGEVCFCFGTRGVYASYGDTPQGMTPFHLVPKSKGILGRAACRHQGDDGMPGVAYLGTDQEVWLIKSATGIREDYGFPTQELTANERGLVRSFLTQTDSPDEALLCMGVDVLSDSLWLTYGSRAMVYRRMNPIDQARGWECYEYAGGGWLRVAFDNPYGIRAIRSNGKFDSLERTTTGAAVRGNLRDGGNAMPDGSWQSGVFQTERARVFAVIAHGTAGAQIRVMVDSDDGANTYTIPAGKRRARMKMNQRGVNHVFTVKLAESEGPVSAIEAELHEIGKKRAL